MLNRLQRTGHLFRVLPFRVALFTFLAQRLNALRKDHWTQISSSPVEHLAELLRLSDGTKNVVELGTASGWTTAALALADKHRTVTSYDPFPELAPHRDEYLRLAGRARKRITLLTRPGSDGPQDDRPVDFLFIDSSHDREPTVAEFQAWEPAVRPGGLVVFDDHHVPEVHAAIHDDLELVGEVRHHLFVWRKPG